MRFPNVWKPFYENHRHRRHIVIVSLKQQFENDDTKDGLPDRTTPAVFENAVQTLMLNCIFRLNRPLVPEYLSIDRGIWDLSPVSNLSKMLFNTGFNFFIHI